MTFSGSAVQTITNANTERFEDLIINNATADVAVVIDDNVEVSGTLTLTAGNIDAGSNKLTLGISTSTVGTLTASPVGFVIGRFERWLAAADNALKLFPLGDNDENYNPAEITFTNNPNGGTVVCQFVDSAPGDNGLDLDDNGKTVYLSYADGYWFWEAGNSFTTNDYDLNLTLENPFGFTIDSDDTRLLTRVDASSAWIADGDHATGTPNQVERDNLGQSTPVFPAQNGLGDGSCSTRPASPSITGTTEVCKEDANETYNSVTAETTYLWEITGGTPVDPAVQNVSVDWTDTDVQNVRLYVHNGCTYSEPFDYAVTVHSIPPTSISGRTIVPQNTGTFTYDVDSPIASNYEYDWTITGGTPATALDVTSLDITWGAAGTGTVSVTATNTVVASGCDASDATTKTVEIAEAIETVGTGIDLDWDDATAWKTGTVPLESQNVKIIGGDKVTVTTSAGNQNEIVNVYVESNGEIAIDVGAGLIASGDVICHGDITSATNNPLVMDGTESSPKEQIDGTGTINVPIEITNISKVIFATADLTIKSIEIDNALNLRNDGTAIITGDIIGNGASAQFINSSTGTLTAQGEVMATGLLTANASGNTVIYAGTGTTIKQTVDDTYHNLEVSAGTKALGFDLTANGDLTISGGDLSVTANNITVEGDYLQSGGTFENSDTYTGTLDINGNVSLSGGTTNAGTSAGHTVAGDWTNTGGTFSSTGTITFDGSAGQTIGGSATTTFNNFILNNSNGLTVDAVADIDGSTTLTSGNIDLNGANMNISGNITATSSVVTGTNAINIDGNVLQTITGVSAISNLTLNNSSGADGLQLLSNDLTISGVLTLTSSNLLTDAGSPTGNVLIMEESATIGASGSSSFVNGRMIYDLSPGGGNPATITLPVGKTIAERKVILTVSSDDVTYTAEYANEDADILAYTIPGTPAITRVSEAGYWSIQSAATGNTTGQFFYTTPDGVTEETTLYILKDNGIGDWVDISNGNGSAAPNGSIITNTFNSFSSFTLATTSTLPTNPLPVELISFMAEINGEGNALLKWKTATEENNEGFYIEKSIDNALTFNQVGFVNGNGNSDRELSYSFTDVEFNQSTYYRLRQMDYDGQFEISPAVFLEHYSTIHPMIYPNPFNNQVTVKLEEDKSFRFWLSDVAGNMILNGFDVTAEDIQAVLNNETLKLKAGIYIIKIFGSGTYYTQRLIKE
ncbi:MAG: T9SS type A sorting domain-containing protein [Bacteroidetes bacterium]|nr:T9SS type A sorting domain-containing protein [Bacteroidota bacterium]MDA1121646.1 T9SS type A sorting domain-containing protein [Bacteroidota bacterium]